MLQQTQVSAVIPYFNRFIKAYPKLEDLANADETQVMDNWSGLGYYSRARNLCKTARQIKTIHRGVFPRDYKNVIALPGIGRYTTGAILSIAFEKPYPIVDGNIRRLILRFLGIDKEVDSKLTSNLWKLLSEIIPEVSNYGSVADFNQALMELGALVCTPRNPSCDECPLQDSCLARNLGIQTKIPFIRKKKKVVKLQFVSLLIRSGKRFLMIKNSRDTFLKDFWEFPKIRCEVNDPDIADKFLKNFEIDVLLDTRLEPVRHQITFRKMIFDPWVARLRAPFVETEEIKWLDPGDPGFPKSAYVLKILGKLEGFQS